MHGMVVMDDHEKRWRKSQADWFVWGMRGFILMSQSLVQNSIEHQLGMECHLKSRLTRILACLSLLISQVTSTRRIFVIIFISLPIDSAR
jgi:hypothetical protein